MNILLLLLAAAPALAVPTSSAREILRRTLEPSAASYDGRVTLESFSPTGAGSREARVRFLNPAHYRREIFDAAGRPAQLIVSDGTTEWVYDKTKNKVWRGEAADADYKQFGSLQEHELLSANYQASVSTASPVARRAVWRLELRSRWDGKIQRRMWVDKQFGLVLRSEIFHQDGRLVSAFQFRNINFGKSQDAALFNFSPPAGVAVGKRLEPDFLALDEAKTATGLNPRTPVWLPSGYVFESLNILPQGGKNIIHYRFSDGINVLSLFQCPPRTRLDFGRKKGRRLRLASGSGMLAETPEGQVLGWSSQGSKFVLISSLDSQILRRVAESVR